MKILRIQQTESQMIKYEIERIENMYKSFIIIGVILLGLGLII